MNTVDRILKLIQESNESDYKVEKLIGLKRASINNWKRGLANPSADALIKIADYFGISLDWLCGRKSYAVADNDFSADEIDLVERYRKLTDDGKRYVLTTIEHELSRTVDPQHAIQRLATAKSKATRIHKIPKSDKKTE
jgi:transcriptional regulator with XRE-family HTH domain